MAYHQVDYLRKVGADGFAIIEKRYGRYSDHQIQRPAPLPARNCWQDQKPAPNQYQSLEPYSYYDHQELDQPHHEEANYGYAAVKEAAAYRPLAASKAKQGHETWYFLPMPPRAPTKEGIEINSNEAAEHYNGILFVEYGHKTKPYRRGHN